MIVTKTGLPHNCEFCGAELVMNGVHLVCNNPSCRGGQDEDIKAWCLSVAPVDGLGWKTIKKLLDKFYPNVHSVSDIYNYVVNNPIKTDKPNSELGLFNQMLDKLKEPIKISQFLLGLNVPGVGKKGAKAVEDFMVIRDRNNISEDLIYGLVRDSKTKHSTTLGKLLQDKNAAESLYGEYNSYLRECYKFVTVLYPDEQQESNKLEKGEVVLTGRLSIKRADYIKQLESSGWVVSSKITKDTKYLITNSPDSGTAKNKEADKLGVTKITEEDFKSIM